MTNLTENSTTQTAPPKAARKTWFGLAIIALPCILYSMDLTVLNLAVPQLSASLQPTSTQLLWIMDIYGFLVAGFLITMGTLGDRIGRRKLLMIGAVAFGAASVLAAYANTAGQLIAARAVLGIAGATLAPSTLSLIRNMFLHPTQRTLAIGVWAASYSAGGAIGPLIGGFMLEHYWWGSVFLLAVPVMVLLLTLAPLLLPEFKDPRAGRLDIFSAFLSLLAVLSIIYGLKQIAVEGFTWLSLLFIAIGIGMGFAFLRRQATLADPLIDIRLFKIPAFSASLFIYGMGCFVMFGSFFFTFQYLQLVLGLTPFQAGLWSLPSFTGFIVGSMLGPFFLKYISPGKFMTGALLLAAVGFILLTQVTAATGIGLLVVALICTALGFAPVVTMATDLIIGSAPPERAGAAGACSETSAEFGGALGMAILGSVGTAVYRSHMNANLPATVPKAAAIAAKQTLGSAVTEATQLTGNAGNELLLAAKNAFVSGLQITAGASVLIIAVLAVLAITRLGKVQPAQH
ncbi:MFS transporter [Paraflavitalea speifideaquila]|uniref:MFS transporter n=1 Tax=Paraflavitalea speifideaquila TaxID=3076558 RepID=UPI0028E69E3E|nr:MFS transporter [Paraflavitalea speifideiaquila]